MNRSVATIEMADDKETAPVLPASEWPNVKVLGVAPRGRMFVDVEGLEYEILGRLHSSQLNDARLPNEYRFERDEEVYERGQGMRHDRYFLRAIQYPAGELARRQRMAEAVETRRATRQGEAAPRFIDVSELHPILSADPGTPLAFGPVDALAAVGSKALKPERAAVALARPFYRRTVSRPPTEKAAIRGIDAIEAWLRSVGVEFMVENGQVLCLARAMSPEVAAVVRDFREPLHGLALGKPLTCPLKHDEPTPAWTVTIGGPAICRQHLDGEM